MKQHCTNQRRRDFEIDSKVYRWMDDPELTDEKRNDPTTVLLKMKDFVEGTNGTHGFFSTMPPEEILSQFCGKMREKGQKFTVSETNMRVNFQVQKQING